MLIYQEGNYYHTSVRAIFTLCNIGVDKPLPLALQIVENDSSSVQNDGYLQPSIILVGYPLIN